MSIITLTTDLGNNSTYVAEIKGELMGEDSSLTLVDISHTIHPFDIAEASFIVKNVFRSFPQGSVHIIGVDTSPKRHKRHVVAKYQGHYFITADNGLFSLMFDGEDFECYELTNGHAESKDYFPTKSIYTQAAYKLIKQVGNLTDYAKPITDYVEKTYIRPVIEENELRGTVVYIDNFKNVFTNITKDTFEQAAKGRQFDIRLSRHENINEISESYDDAAEGEKVCMFNENGFMQIAINRGEAAPLLGLRKGSVIIVDFI